MWNRLQGLMAELLPGWARRRALLRHRRTTARPLAKAKIDPPPADHPPAGNKAPPTGGGNG